MQHVYTYELPKGDVLVEEHSDVHALAVLSTVLVSVYVFFAALATCNVHAEVTPLALCRYTFRWRAPQRSALGKYPRRADIFFLMLHCFIVLPLVQLFCVWRVHRDAHATRVTLMVWSFVLVLGVVTFLASMVYDSRRTYYLHASVSMHLPMSLMFAAEGVARADASGDILVAALMFAFCLMHTFVPPLVLRENHDILRKAQKEANRRYMQNMWRENDAGAKNAAADDSSGGSAVPMEDLFGNVGAVAQPQAYHSAHYDNVDSAEHQQQVVDFILDTEARESANGVNEARRADNMRYFEAYPAQQTRSRALAHAAQERLRNFKSSMRERLTKTKRPPVPKSQDANSVQIERVVAVAQPQTQVMGNISSMMASPAPKAAADVLVAVQRSLLDTSSSSSESERNKHANKKDDKSASSFGSDFIRRYTDHVGKMPRRAPPKPPQPLPILRREAPAYDKVNMRNAQIQRAVDVERELEFYVGATAASPPPPPPPEDEESVPAEAVYGTRHLPIFGGEEVVSVKKINTGE